MELVVAGVGAVPVTRSRMGSLPDGVARTVRAALADARIEAADVDGLFFTPARISADPWMMFAARMAEHLGFRTSCLTECANGGATALMALRSAMDAVALGRCRVAVVVASDDRPSLDLRHVQPFMRGACFQTMALHGPFNALFGFGAPVPFYAMGHQRYMHEHGVDEAQIAEVSVVLRRHAAAHPLAQFRDPVTIDDVLSSPVVSPPIHLMQAASVSAGICVAVVTRADVAPDTDRPPVTLAGWGEAHDPTHFVPSQGPITTFGAVRRATATALSEAGCGIGDIDVAEVYGVFGATELMLYEDLGFCEPGTAASFVAEGRSTVGGDVLINPTGGRISFGHPAGATPLYEVIEVARQLRGDAPGLAAPDPTWGLVQAEHGMCNGAVVMVLKGGQA